jgi:prepilin peptidase CpaA
MILYFTLTLFASGIIIFAAVNDFLHLKIPNIISLTLVFLFFIAFSIDYFFIEEVIFESLFSHVKIGLIVFIIMLIAFFMKYMGGGDAKLIPAIALWVGTEGVAQFAIVTAFIGMPLALIALFFSRTSVGLNLAEKIARNHFFSQGWINALANKKNVVPYGIAIAIGGLYAFFDVGYFALNS